MLVMLLPLGGVYLCAGIVMFLCAGWSAAESPIVALIALVLAAWMTRRAWPWIRIVARVTYVIVLLMFTRGWKL